MGFYLNNDEPYSMYQEMAQSPYFVDKTAMINEIIPRIGIAEKYICVTRPRRFGKSVMASMLGAFFSKACIPRNFLTTWIFPGRRYMRGI